MTNTDQRAPICLRFVDERRPERNGFVVRNGSSYCIEPTKKNAAIFAGTKNAIRQARKWVLTVRETALGDCTCYVLLEDLV